MGRHRMLSYSIIIATNRLRDKFVVHAQDDKANALVSLTEKFLDSQLDSFYSKVWCDLFY